MLTLRSESSNSEDLARAICLPLLVSLARPQDARTFPLLTTVRNGEKRPLRCGSLTSSSILSCVSIQVDLRPEVLQNANTLRTEANGRDEQHKTLERAVVLLLARGIHFCSLLSHRELYAALEGPVKSYSSESHCLLASFGLYSVQLST